ncbi:MAG: MATE family efflux transporter [Burkholderiales bacterium]|jgi:MATE family multidrug resistance protein|nr:MATE family efflux transporter [Burkholderiales bacterium]
MSCPTSPNIARPSSDFRTIVSHAVTVFVGQIAVMSYGVIDTIVSGRHSELSLAALAVGTAILVTVYVSMTGLVQALLPIWAEMRGAHRPADIGPSIRQTLYVCAAASVLGIVVLLHPGSLLRWAEVPADLQPIVRHYLAVASWGLPMALLFRVFSTLSQALGAPKLVTWLQIVSLGVKLPLSIWLTFGGAGVSAMGVVGCAWATLAVNGFLCLLALILLRTQTLYAPLALWRPLERPHWPTLLAFARLGLPAALSVLVEVTSFTLMALFIARLGTTATAAHQIAANVAVVLYMAPLALGVAASARVGYWRGAGDEARARRVALRSLAAAMLMGLTLSIIIFIAKPWIVTIYARQAGVTLLAAQLLAWVALYHLADSTQVVAVFLLRCYRVTLTPVIVYSALLWGLGLAGGYALAYHGLGAFPALRSPVAFWQAAAVALLLAAAAMTLMLRRTGGKATTQTITRSHINF